MQKNILNKNATTTTTLSYSNLKDSEEIIVPNHITKIGKSTFENFKNIKRIILPEGLIEIDEESFKNCTHLEEIVIPSTLKKIHKNSFENCYRLKNINLPESLEIIEEQAFKNCSSLEEITIPKNIINLPNYLFSGCTNLKEVNLSDKITTIPEGFFHKCKNLNFNFSNNIQIIEEFAFDTCHRQSIFPKSASIIGAGAFKNCHSLNEIELNSKIKFIEAETFLGCTNLIKVSHEGTLRTGIAAFKNCYRLSDIPDNILGYEDQSFENCRSIKSLTLRTPHISNACFRGCTSLESIKNPAIITSMDSNAFANCTSLNNVYLPHCYEIESEVFNNCTGLTNIELSPFTKKIGYRSFYKCENITNFNLPQSLEDIGKEAFKYCNSIKSITIPMNIEHLNNGQFSAMASLETINIDPRNKHLHTPDNKIVFDRLENVIMYAAGNKDKKYSLKPFCYEENSARIIPIKSINDYAFAGAKHLEELIICSCTDYIEPSSFDECDNLKKLTIERIPLYSSHSISNQMFFDFEENKSNFLSPLRELEYRGDFTHVSAQNTTILDNITKLKISSKSPLTIRSHSFLKLTNLEKITITNNIISIEKNSFHPNTMFEYDLSNYTWLDHTGEKIDFTNYKNLEEIKKTKVIKDFVKLDSVKLASDYSVIEYEKDNFLLISENNVYYLSKEIINSYNGCNDDIKNPALFINYLLLLKKYDIKDKELINSLLINNFEPTYLEELFKRIKNSNEFTNKLKSLQSSNNTLYLLENPSQLLPKLDLLVKLNENEPTLYLSSTLSLFTNEVFENLVVNHKEAFIKYLTYINRIKPQNDVLFSPVFGHKIAIVIQDINNYFRNNTSNTVASLIIDMEQADKTSSFLYNITISQSKSPLRTKFIKNYDAHLQRVINASNVLTTENNANISDNHQNFIDLLNLLEAIGGLEDDPITRQKACNFVTENIFNCTMPNGETNNRRLIGNDIHRFFNFNEDTTKYDKDFAEFFIHNYNDLKNINIFNHNAIPEIYENFDEIKKVSIADNGSRRQLKVTLERCKRYFENDFNIFANQEDKEIIEKISKWCRKIEVVKEGIKIIKEAKELNPPRNIFTKTKTDENNNLVFDNSSDNDLKEPIREDFSYEWLPKQDPYNLVLGNYCNCCAHMNGVGRGIMHASINRNDCQNLIIRDNVGEIIGKATLAINRERKYGVFNTFESTINKRSDNDLNNLYNALIRGTDAFIEAYNSNNEENKLQTITMGTGSNTILKRLRQNHETTNVLSSIDYSNHNPISSAYKGNWQDGQVLIKKI